MIVFLCSIFALGALIEVMEGDGTRLWNALTGKDKLFLRNFLAFDLSNLVELSAFMPALWTMYRAGRRDPNDTFSEVEPAGVRIQAVCFFAWLLGFHFYEDLQQARDASCLLRPCRCLTTFC